MIQIIVILAIYMLIVPLLDLTLAERVRYFAKIVLYAVALAWIIYTLWIVKGVHV